MKNLILTALTMLVTLNAYAWPPGGGSSKIQTLKQSDQDGADVLTEALSAVQSKIDVKFNMTHVDYQGKTWVDPTTATVVIYPREEPEAEFATNFILLNGNIFQFGKMDIQSVTDAGTNQIRIVGETSTYMDEDAKQFTVCSEIRTVVVQFADMGHVFAATAKIVSQSAKTTCSR